jgi:hypothetical protein
MLSLVFERVLSSKQSKGRPLVLTGFPVDAAAVTSAVAVPFFAAPAAFPALVFFPVALVAATSAEAVALPNIVSMLSS